MSRKYEAYAKHRIFRGGVCQLVDMHLQRKPIEVDERQFGLRS